MVPLEPRKKSPAKPPGIDPETLRLYNKYHTEYINELCGGKKMVFINVTAGGKCSYQWALIGKY
jgi:hypothetical protein